MPKTKRYREARQIQKEEGGSYTAALRSADQEHGRQKAVREESNGRTSAGRPHWSETSGLTNHLRSILAPLDTGEAFVAAPEPSEKPFGRAFAPEAGTLVLDDKWRMELIATGTLLAERVRVSPPSLHS